MLEITLKFFRRIILKLKANEKSFNCEVVSIQNTVTNELVITMNLTLIYSNHIFGHTKDI
jgi:hypothetical protein